jgi:FtsP/CotA-like multicopper oxidase with cupredoxin domain
MAVIVVGNKVGWLAQNKAYAAEQVLTFEITDAMKHMATHLEPNPAANPSFGGNDAQCYYWVYKCNTPEPNFPLGYPAEVPGPVIMANHGDVITIHVTNNLDQPHTLSVPSLGVNSAPIAPGASADITITASVCGSHLYYDNLNAPVNRMMGLHGALIVMPVEADRTPGHNLTPYGGLAASHGVQRLYDDFGNSQPGTALTTKTPRATPPHFPGLAWEEGDASQWALWEEAVDGLPAIVNCPPYRNYIWLLHQASPKLFAEVGEFSITHPGQNYPAQQFMDLFLRDSFQPHTFHSDNPNGNHIPQYFTINGQSGFFSHFSPYTTPMGRVGEPVVVHIMNAGLWAHSMHLHANHFWVTSVNGTPNPNPIWLDVFRVDPMDRIDYTVPFMRPPDTGNEKGIGPYALSEPILQSDNGHPLWPPVEEFSRYMPALGTKAKAADGVTDVEMGQRMSPLCYPMHDHSEPSQTSQGGNYNTGLISGAYFTGDRQGMMDFPMDEDFHMAYRNSRGCIHTERAAPPIGERS